MITNGYATLPEYMDYGVARADSEDEIDDAVIERIINAASRYIDNKTGRRFYPSIATRYYDASPDPTLRFGADLLEVITLLNGETTAIASTSYNLLPLNSYPKYALKLISSSNVYWQQDANSESEGVIPLTAIWGWHERYNTEAWEEITAINEAGNITAATVEFAVDSSVALLEDGGQLLRIDDEIMRYEGKSLTDITVERGVNGSTAAIHLDDAPVYLWHPQDDINLACLDIVNGIYKRRTGENATATSVLTTGGVIVTPREISSFAGQVISDYSRIV